MEFGKILGNIARAGLDDLRKDRHKWTRGTKKVLAFQMKSYYAVPEAMVTVIED